MLEFSSSNPFSLVRISGRISSNNFSPTSMINENLQVLGRNQTEKNCSLFWKKCEQLQKRSNILTVNVDLKTSWYWTSYCILATKYSLVERNNWKTISAIVKRKYDLQFPPLSYSVTYIYQRRFQLTERKMRRRLKSSFLLQCFARIISYKNLISSVLLWRLYWKLWCFKLNKKVPKLT